MIKHRSLTLFTASNPSIPASGVVGESKADILRGLSGARGAVARFVLIPGGLPSEKSARASQFMTAQGVGFRSPSNHGQRGSGVVIVRTLDAPSGCARPIPTDTILRRFISGDEFGIFTIGFRRSLPTLSSHHTKTFPTVRGDGVSTLERLILSDDRAVCAAAPCTASGHYERLDEASPAGHVFPLAELGSHCRGGGVSTGVAVDGGAGAEDRCGLRAASAASTGRFDVRVPGGADALRLGEGIRVLELNGVTSEATHIYHPGTPCCPHTACSPDSGAWRSRSARRPDAGVRPVRLRELLMMAVAYRREARGHLR